jgi:hypothetical protein
MPEGRFYLDEQRDQHEREIGDGNNPKISIRKHDYPVKATFSFT